MSIKDLEASMRKSVEATRCNLNAIRTSRASSSLLDRVNVEYYGIDTPLKALATLSTPDSQTIQIQPFDTSKLGVIEKAITKSELGFTPNNDGKVIRINVPPLTEERRKEFCKLAAKYSEEGKVALRNLRRDAIDKIKKQEKNGDFSEDQSRDEQDTIQKVLDKFIAELEKHLAEKEVDILKV
ncbi:ribosome recycling factor [Synechococcus sp. M16CYN]|uniref:ribosome recycling factor n=1 Tax=Synechococcus sp. M16CYN TaxID=3103139 RepID=UPI00325209A5